MKYAKLETFSEQGSEATNSYFLIKYHLYGTYIVFTWIAKRNCKEASSDLIRISCDECMSGILTVTYFCWSLWMIFVVFIEKKRKVLTVLFIYLTLKRLKCSLRISWNVLFQSHKTVASELSYNLYRCTLHPGMYSVKLSIVGRSVWYKLCNCHNRKIRSIDP